MRGKKILSPSFPFKVSLLMFGIVQFCDTFCFSLCLFSISTVDMHDLLPFPFPFPSPSLFPYTPPTTQTKSLKTTTSNANDIVVQYSQGQVNDTLFWLLLTSKVFTY